MSKVEGVFFVKPEYTSALCQIALWGSGDCSLNTFTSFIGYYEVAQETGDSYNKTVPQCNWTQYLTSPNRPLAR